MKIKIRIKPKTIKNEKIKIKMIQLKGLLIISLLNERKKIKEILLLFIFQ